MAVRLIRAILIRLLLFTLFWGFLAYVWPTRYKYDHVSTDGNTYPVRMDRFTGDSDMLVPDQGWVPVEGTEGDGNQAAPTRARHRPS